jgi:flagellar basal-body rod protein FlgF
MDRLAFTAVRGIAEKALSRQQMTNELANVSTVGFKRSFDTIVKAIKLEGKGFETRIHPYAVPSERINLDGGQLMFTGRKSDVAMLGQTVMGVEAPNGDLAFTRRGDLRPDTQGTLVNGSGHIIQGEGGPIVVPPGFQVFISKEGGVYATDPAQGAENAPVQVGQLLLRDASETPLKRREDGLFEPLTGPGDFTSGNRPVGVTTEVVEGSNVNAAEAMIRLIDHARSFEVAMKVISESKSIDESGSSMLRGS